MCASNLNSPKDLSRSLVKFIKSLQIKKYRLEEKSFLIEGAKNVKALLASDYDVQIVVGTPAFIEAHRALLVSDTIEIFRANQKLLASLGTFQTNNAALAVASFQENKLLTIAKQEYGLVLDAIRDPGNLGTIL
ncbi:MAG: RNA methyltransferase, partial [Cytophagales bacterium]|nr:RNA methyltransferase [Cytophagales bacterium]